LRVSRVLTLAILSDIHYASAAEQARGGDYELSGISNPIVRAVLKAYRHFVWLRNPLRQNNLLDRFLDEIGAPDCVVAVGDYSCNSAFVGVSDDASCQSVHECLGKLRQRFGDRFRAVIGDHDLGKVSLLGDQGAMRLASWRRATCELGLESFWEIELGNYVLMGIASSLVALPIFELDTSADERPEWERLRAEHLSEIRRAFESLKLGQKVLLFSHDPSALPFLLHEDAVRSKLLQVEQTIVGHLHSDLVFWKSRVLAGMPRITFLGHSVRRFSTALRDARCWQPFKVRLCPALAGIELLKDGGYLTAELDAEADRPVRFRFHRLPR
jgi:hypothetical protein